MNKNTGIIIQARLGSSRLKNKMILPFYDGKSILEIVIKKLQKAFSNMPIILATTDNEQDEAISDIAITYGISYYRGSESNVLDRFIKAAEKYKLDKIVRVCSDNPFLSIDFLNQIIVELDSENQYDYISFHTDDNTPVIKTHFGFFAEMVSLSALKNVAVLSDDKLYLEHVTNYIYTFPDDFKIKWLNLPGFLKGRTDIRLTIDTQQDFNTAQEILKLSERGIENLKINEIISLVDKNSDIRDLMEKEISINSK